MKIIRLYKLILMLKNWLLAEMLILGLVGLVYVSGQHILRSSANDPQAEVTQDFSRLLASGDLTTDQLGGSGTIDPSLSLAPFYMVFDANKALLTTTASFNSETPVPAEDAFRIAKANGSNYFTWSPVSGTRIATIISYYNGEGGEGFVLAGKSLKEVDNRINQTALYSVLALLLLTFGNTIIFVGSIIIERKFALITMQKISEAKVAKEPKVSKAKTKAKN